MLSPLSRVSLCGTQFSSYTKVRNPASVSCSASLTPMSGYYSDAVLKFRLAFPRNYPERPPVVQFVTDVFHPLVAQDGIFNLAPRFRPWRYEQRKVRVYRGLTLS